MYVLKIVVCPFVLFLLAIVLSVLLPYTDSDYTPLVPEGWARKCDNVADEIDTRQQIMIPIY